MKKTIAMLLAVMMIVGLFAGCGGTQPSTTTAPSTTAGDSTTAAPELVVEKFEGQYTYTDWVVTLSNNWNPHTYETTDQSYPMDFLGLGFYSFIFNDEINPVDGKEPYAGYVVVPEMAAAEPVDVTEQIKADHPEFGIPESATAGYAYTLDLNPNATWQDGTPITAVDYVESFKRLLDPKMNNYRAANYYEGSFSIVGAEEYANQGLTVKRDNGVTGAYTIADLTKGEDGNYYTPDGGAVYIGVNYALDWTGGNTLKAYVDNYGATYFGLDRWEELVALMDEDGLVPANDDTLAMLAATTTTNEGWGETEEDLPAYLVYDATYGEFSYDGVGLYQSGDYQITMVLNKSLGGFNLLYSLTSNWLVKTDLYDSCIKETTTAGGTAYTTTYNTSVETTCSYGPYIMDSFQTDKGMHFTKNENWYGYSDGKHIYKDPQNGKVYPMYMTTDIDCQVVADSATAKLMFLKGELMTYGLQTDDYDTYRNSDYAHFTPGQAVYFMILNGNMPAIQEREAAADFDQTKFDLETLSLTSFHRAMGLAYDKDLYCAENSPAQSAAFGLVGTAYICDPETGTKYRDTEQAKKALCEVYGVDTTKFESLDDAVASITGYDAVEAGNWFRTAYDEALAAGYVTDTDGDGLCDQTIQITYANGSDSAVSERMLKMLKWLTDKANLAATGTPFEGKIEFVASAPLGNNWSDQVKAGLCDVVLAGWNGSAMDPYGLMEVYTNPNYQYDAQWWSASNVDMTLTINGEEITMNLSQWQQCMNGTTVTVSDKDYNFGEGQVSNDVRLEIMAGIEKAVLLEYNYLPLSQAGSMQLLSQKAYYVVEEYNPVMDFGGITYLRYEYNDTEWTDYVASVNGELTY